MLTGPKPATPAERVDYDMGWYYGLTHRHVGDVFLTMTSAWRRGLADGMQWHRNSPWPEFDAIVRAQARAAVHQAVLAYFREHGSITDGITDRLGVRP